MAELLGKLVDIFFAFRGRQTHGIRCTTCFAQAAQWPSKLKFLAPLVRLSTFSSSLTTKKDFSSTFYGLWAQSHLITWHLVFCVFSVYYYSIVVRVVVCKSHRCNSLFQERGTVFPFFAVHEKKCNFESVNSIWLKLVSSNSSVFRERVVVRKMCSGDYGLEKYFTKASQALTHTKLNANYRIERWLREWETEFEIGRFVPCDTLKNAIEHFIHWIALRGEAFCVGWVEGLCVHFIYDCVSRIRKWLSNHWKWSPIIESKDMAIIINIWDDDCECYNDWRSHWVDTFLEHLNTSYLKTFDFIQLSFQVFNFTARFHKYLS